jgi:ABC-type glycerol-3-phosphate transport system substrate-binding protein
MKAKKFLFVTGVMILTAASLFAGGGAQKPADSGTLTGEIRFSWWGNETRNAATIEAIRDYESKHPGVKISPEYSTLDGFYSKLMAQIAAGSAVDVFSANVEWLPTIYENNGMLDLTDLVDVSTHNPQVNLASTINGKLYGVGISLNANVLYYNKTLADELGIKIPTGDYTWADLQRMCEEVYVKSGGQTYGMIDLRMVSGCETWMPAFNKTHDGKEPPFPWTEKDIYITGADVQSYMEFFGKFAKGALMPPDEVATLSNHVDVPIARRKVFFSYEYSGTLSMIQAQTKDEISMIEAPNDKAGKGNAVSARPGMVLCVYPKSKHQALAVDFIKYFANDPAAGLILKGCRGVLPSSIQREAILANPNALSDVDKKIFAITDQVYKKNVDVFYPPPPAIAAMFEDNAFRNMIGQEVGFGRMTPQEAGKRFDELLKEMASR